MDKTLKEKIEKTVAPAPAKPRSPRGPKRPDAEIRADAVLRLAKMDLKEARARANEAEESLITAVSAQALNPNDDPENLEEISEYMSELIRLRRAEFALESKIKNGANTA